MGDVQAVDFVVVGAGMAGAAAAALLASTGRVAVLEAESQPGYHSTGRSAAFYSENYGNALIRGLTRASRTFLFEPPTGFSPVPLCRPRRGLYFARADQLEDFEAFAADPAVAASTVRVTLEEICALIPLLRSSHIVAGLVEAGAADLDVDALHQGFLRQARRSGASLHVEAPVQALRREGGRWIAATPAGVFAAPVLINAAGAWGDRIAALGGVAPIGLQPMRRTAVLMPVPEGLDADAWPAAVDIREEFYFKPDAGLLMLSPADEIPSPPCDAQPEELDVAIAIDRFEQATGVQVRQIKRTWAGLRVFTPDRSPVVGFDPAAPGFFWLVGLGGYGIQTAPAIGRIAAALATGKPIPEDIAREGVRADLLSRGRFDSSAPATDAAVAHIPLKD